MKRRTEVKVLLVEDDPAHVTLALVAIERANKANGKNFVVKIARDGEEALEILASGYRPELILLDLKLPKKSGKEVLRVIKADPALRVIPVIMLTTSDQEQDVLESYQAYVSAYVVKPLKVEPFIDTIKRIKSFWASDDLILPLLP